jgi:F-type H+-transporting ATPase subunit epsilon
MAFNCVVVTPEQQMLDQQVTQVIFPAYDGQIGILTNRAPLLAKLGIGELKADLVGGGEKSFFIAGGVAQMKDNKLTVLTTEAIAREEIDAESARAQLAEATARTATDRESAEDRTRQMERARKMVELARG